MGLEQAGVTPSEAGTSSSGLNYEKAVSAPPAADSSAGGTVYQAKEGSITVKVPQGTLAGKFEDAKALLKESGADVNDIRYYESGSRKEYHITVKVVPSRFDEINSKLSVLGDVKDLSLSIEDVTKQYQDLDTRIKNREIELSRLTVLYNQTDNVSDLLSIEKEITRVETDLEILKGEKQYLVSRIEKSTLTVVLYEDKPASNQLSLSIEGIGQMFFGAISAALTLLVLAIGFLLPIALVMGAVWWIYKKIRGNGAARPRKSEHSQIPPPL